MTCNVMSRPTVVALAAMLVLATAQAALAQMTPIDPGLPGITSYDEWDNLTISANPGYGSFPGSGAWPAPIGSQTLGSGDATLNKLANGTGGGPYPASGSMYYGGFSADINNPGGVLGVEDLTPLADVANIVLQIQIGEAWTFDFLDHELPVLNFNGGTQELAATNTVLLEQFFAGTVEMPTGTENVYINTYLLQWDATSLGALTDFEITFEGVQHAQLYKLRLDQSNEFAAVPEPGTVCLAGLGLMGLVGLVRRQRRKR